MERRKPFMQNVKTGGPATIFDIKVMLCYLLNSLNKPISAEDLLNVMMSEELVNYFEYESAMAELVKGGQVEKFVSDSEEEFYQISKNGAALVVDLESSLAMSLKSRVVAAAIKVLTFKQNAEENNVEVTAAEGGGYNLTLEVPGEPQPLCKLQLYFPERLQAEMARDGFLTNPTLVYAAILAALSGDLTALMTALKQ
ncbi:MAG: DUF4364 family protein [Oscillospiraceae bacterium]|nr:DUF4364 family protein [Oscillospiraceae bacterium]